MLVKCEAMRRISKKVVESTLKLHDNSYLLDNLNLHNIFGNEMKIVRKNHVSTFREEMCGNEAQ